MEAGPLKTTQFSSLSHFTPYSWSDYAQCRVECFVGSIHQPFHTCPKEEKLMVKSRCCAVWRPPGGNGAPRKPTCKLVCTKGSAHYPRLPHGCCLQLSEGSSCTRGIGFILFNYPGFKGEGISQQDGTWPWKVQVEFRDRLIRWCYWLEFGLIPSWASDLNFMNKTTTIAAATTTIMIINGGLT